MQSHSVQTSEGRVALNLFFKCKVNLAELFKYRAFIFFYKSVLNKWNLHFFVCFGKGEGVCKQLVLSRIQNNQAPAFLDDLVISIIEKITTASNFLFKS